jgi:hypothetical protein
VTQGGETTLSKVRDKRGGSGRRSASRRPSNASGFSFASATRIEPQPRVLTHHSPSNLAKLRTVILQRQIPAPVQQQRSLNSFCPPSAKIKSVIDRHWPHCAKAHYFLAVSNNFSGHLPALPLTAVPSGFCHSVVQLPKRPERVYTVGNSYWSPHIAPFGTTCNQHNQKCHFSGNGRLRLGVQPTGYPVELRKPQRQRRNEVLVADRIGQNSRNNHGLKAPI